MSQSRRYMCWRARKQENSSLTTQPQEETRASGRKDTPEDIRVPAHWNSRGGRDGGGDSPVGELARRIQATERRVIGDGGRGQAKEREHICRAGMRSVMGRLPGCRIRRGDGREMATSRRFRGRACGLVVCLHHVAGAGEREVSLQ